MTARASRLAAAAAALGLLSACNVVITKQPLFTQADTAGAPALRPGVWLFFRQADCAVDESQPFTQWPDCAGGGLVTPAGAIRAHKDKAPPDVLEDTPIVLAAGEPRILQAPIDVDMSVSAEASATGDAQVSTSGSSVSAKPYAYAGVQPTKLDDQGRIVAFHFWPVQCGPPPPKDKDGNDVAGGTLKPLPGIEMKKGDAVCTTNSVAALRGAAKASQAWVTDPMGDAHWLRDADR